MKVVSKKSKSGQNTAEYLVMLILIAVGSIGVFSAFGATLKKHVNNAVVVFTGGAPTADELDYGKLAEGSRAAEKGGHGMNLTADQVKRYGTAATPAAGTK